MTPAFGFSAGDFIAAIEVCTKVAKALKDTGTAATEYQQVVVELQGLQNILIRLAALEPTESNIQHVNAIRGAALASTLSLQEFILKVEKFDHSMSPFAAKKPFSASKAGRQAQYALFMAEEVKKMRAVIYGNVLRINVLLATHASETLSRTEERQMTNHHDLTRKLNETKSDMSKIIKDIEEMRAELIVNREEVCRESLSTSAQIQELSKTTEAHNASAAQSLSNLSAGISSIAASINGIRNISSQVISLLRLIPSELGGMIQNVIRSNARIESTLLRIDRNIPNSPSLSLDTNIRIEDALGRPHDLPFEWFQYWETFEGLLKAKFKDVPGNQKIVSGNFRLVHANRPSVFLDKNTWSTNITPGAHIIMLMLITHIPSRESSCPRRSCLGKVHSIPDSKNLVICPKCDLRFISQTIPAESVEVDEVTKIQHIEDAKLFGDIGDHDISRKITDVTEDIEMMDVSGNASAEASGNWATRTNTPVNTFHESSTALDENDASFLSPLQTPEPPIVSWLAHTEPPQDPDSVRQWRDAAESEQLEFKEREAEELEVFRNVQIVMPTEAAAPDLSNEVAGHLEENILDVGARVHYRNILDRYPRIDHSLAQRFANANWERQKRLVARQSEAERGILRAASRNEAPERIRKRKIPKSKAVLFQYSDPEEQECAMKTNNEREDLANGKLFDTSTSRSSPHLSFPTADVEVLPNHLEPDPEGRLEDKSSKDAEPNHAEMYNGIDVLPLFTHSLQNHDSRRDWPMDIEKAKVRKLCSLPPLPVPLTEADAGGNAMLCYLCHSQVHIGKKQTWRRHVMNDLVPYMCPFDGCENRQYSKRRDLSAHMISLHQEECDKCPFCGHFEFSKCRGEFEMTYAKHVGRHMEEIAFAVVSTAYEDWSYDESGSDIGAMSLDSVLEHALGYDDTWMSEPAQVSRSLDTTKAIHESMKQALVDQEDEPQFEKNFWTGEMTPTSSHSSANSGLRDPYPSNYLSTGSVDRASHDSPSPFSRANSPLKQERKSDNLRKQNLDGYTGKRVGGQKRPMTLKERKKYLLGREMLACLRCKILKRPCSKITPCHGCRPSRTRLWQIPCTRMDIKDLGFFLIEWKVDYIWPFDPDSSIGSFDEIAPQESLAHISHGYGPWLPMLSVQPNAGFFNPKRTIAQHTQDLQRRLDGVFSGLFIREHYVNYIDQHIDGDFGGFVYRHFEGTPFLTECLKTIYHYYVKNQSFVLRKALRLLVAYNLTRNPALMQKDADRDHDNESCNKIAAPIMITLQVRSLLAHIWRDMHKDLLQELDKLYSTVYSGLKLKHWDKVIFVTIIILAIWEEMQFDCHFREPEEPTVQKFCRDMEDTPVGVLIGLYRAISHRLPRLEDWDVRTLASEYFQGNEALHVALTEMKLHILKYENYLKARQFATFVPSRPDSLSNKFLARLILRERLS